MDEITQIFAGFPAEHAYRHKLRPDGRESLAHMLMFPEQGIAGFVYPTVRAAGPAKGRAYLFGPALPSVVAEEIEVPVSADLNFDNWQTGPLLMAVREPHRTVDLKWDGPRIKLDLHFEAMHPPYAFSSHPGGNPPYYGDDRTEQHGRLSADVTVDALSFHHDGYLIRDHSWGPRIWGLNQHHKWLHMTTPSCSIHVFEMQSFGSTHLRGYLFKDGVMRHIASVDYKLGYDDEMMQQSIAMTVTDTDGRIVKVDCQTFAAIQLDSWDPKVFLNETALTVAMEGETGAGWAEFCWNRNYFEFAKDYVARFA